MSNVITLTYRNTIDMCIQMVSNDCKKTAGRIVICKQTSFGRKLSVQRQTKVKIHMSYIITLIYEKV